MFKNLVWKTQVKKIINTAAKSHELVILSNSEEIELYI